jgi:hypothetical protein
MATYNCSDSTNSAYGAGGYGTCTGQSIGAPNTGFFNEVIYGGSFAILAPLALAVVGVVIATVLLSRKKKKNDATPTE